MADRANRAVERLKRAGTVALGDGHEETTMMRLRCVGRRCGVALRGVQRRRARRRPPSSAAPELGRLSLRRGASGSSSRARPTRPWRRSPAAPAGAESLLSPGRGLGEEGRDGAPAHAPAAALAAAAGLRAAAGAGVQGSRGAPGPVAPRAGRGRRPGPCRGRIRPWPSSWPRTPSGARRRRSGVGRLDGAGASGARREPPPPPAGAGRARTPAPSA